MTEEQFRDAMVRLAALYVMTKFFEQADSEESMKEAEAFYRWATGKTPGDAP